MLNIRLTKTEDAEGRAKSSRRPRKRRRVRTDPQTSEGDTSDEDIVPRGKEMGKDASAMEAELQELEDEEIRRTNAYPGASNTIGSIHQRKWYLSLDREACGFEERKEGGRTVWRMPSATDEEHEEGDAMQRLSFPFYVRGVEHERSVVTARRAEDIMRDEGVGKFVRRKGWLPVLN